MTKMNMFCSDISDDGIDGTRSGELQVIVHNMPLCCQDNSDHDILCVNRKLQY